MLAEKGGTGVALVFILNETNRQVKALGWTL